MIQDIAPHTYHNEYKPSAPDKNSFILAYEKGSILLPGSRYLFSTFSGSGGKSFKSLQQVHLSVFYR